MPRNHNVTIARSGVQYYGRDELIYLGLSSVPREFAHLRVFGVYRPAFRVEQCAELFKKAPVVVGHQNWIKDESDPNIIGRVGDSVSVKVKNGEATLYSTLQFADERYDTKRSELSPGYWEKCAWGPGVSPEGIEFQIVMGEVTSVNHLALVPKARGGDGIRILDGGATVPKRMQILSGLLHYARKAVLGIQDGEESDAFKNTIQDVLKNRTEWTDEEMTEHCTTLLALTEDLPDSEEKEKLLRFIADVPLLRNEDDDTALLFGNTVVQLFEQLDTDAVEDVVSGKQGERMPTPDEKNAGPAIPDANASGLPAAAPATPVMPVEEPKAAEPTMADVMAVLAEIATSLKVIAGSEKKEEIPADPAKPADATPPTPEKKESDVPEAEKKDGIGDAAMSTYTQSMATIQTGASLDALMDRFKGKGRS